MFTDTKKEKGMEIKNWMTEVIKGIVDNPEKVDVIAKFGEQTLVIEALVDRSDIGKVVGKKGRNASALRTLLIAAASKNDIRAVLEIVE